MRRKWNLFNTDKREKAWTASGVYESLIFAPHEWLVKLLARPNFSDTVPAYYLDPYKSDKDELGALARLPEELLIYIVSLTSLDDAACLASTHRLLALEGFFHVRKLQRRKCAHWGSWAGDRIVTVGDSASVLPPGILSPEEEAETEGHFFNFAWDRYERRPTTDGMALNCAGDEAGVPHAALKRLSRHERGDHIRIRLLLKSTRPRYTSTGSWALCNVDRKQYVRANVLADMKMRGYWPHAGWAEGPFVRRTSRVIDLGGLALIMTAGSEDIGATGSVPPWAGDRLTVTTVGDLSEPGWEDVSSTGRSMAEDCIIADDGMMWKPWQSVEDSDSGF
ncbi:unnamed protein product [Peniophora sp. CBMAI 1063]|nr:unnamed protein product [Peniophora sp. CBMAI 1063]